MINAGGVNNLIFLYILDVLKIYFKIPALKLYWPLHVVLRWQLSADSILNAQAMIKCLLKDFIDNELPVTSAKTS